MRKSAQAFAACLCLRAISRLYFCSSPRGNASGSLLARSRARPLAHSLAHRFPHFGKLETTCICGATTLTTTTISSGCGRRSAWITRTQSKLAAAGNKQQPVWRACRWPAVGQPATYSIKWFRAVREVRGQEGNAWELLLTLRSSRSSSSEGLRNTHSRPGLG